MSLEVRLGQRQEQRLALLPQMLQSIEVLQLATEDLLAYVENELQTNETLEIRSLPKDPELPVAKEPVELPDSGWEGEWRRPTADDGEDGKFAWLNNLPAGGATLVDVVREQLSFRDLPALLRDAVVALAERLDERGLLPFALADVAAELEVPVDLLEQARAVLLTLEPRGIGAFDPVEAMLVQAAGDPDLPVIERILRDHLPALGRNKLPEVARDLELSVAELQDLLQRMRELQPRPAAEFHATAATAIVPDAYVVVQAGEVQVGLQDGMLPELGVVEDYAALAGDRAQARELRSYLQPKLRAARDLIEAVQQRQATLRAVVLAVMQEQSAFLARGKSAIKPLRMSEVAERLGMHTSTVSRAIAGKHVQTERGLFLLRDFFDGSRIDAAPKAGQGKMALAEQIQELVDAEDKSAPLSDDDLVARLVARGVQAARRTITKYRQELGIPSSYQRRRFGGEA
jgi:RNA polymerase sigma-54 factor